MNEDGGSSGWSSSESDESESDGEIDYNQEDIWKQFLKDKE